MAIQQKDIDRIDELYKSIIRLIDLGEVVAALALSRNLLESLSYLVLESEGIKYNISIKSKMIALWAKQVADESIAMAIQSMHQWANNAIHLGNDSNISRTNVRKNWQLIWNWWESYLIAANNENIKEIPHAKRERFIALRSFYIENYQGIEKIEENDLPLDAHFIVFTGENGYGKTSILQALAIAFCGNEDTQSKRFLSNAEKCHIAIQYRFPYKGLIKNEFTGYRNATVINSLKNFAAYGASRLQLQSEESMEQGIARRNPAYHLFYTDGILLNIEHWLLKQDENLKDNIINTLTAVLPNINAIEMGDSSLSFKDHNEVHNVMTLSAGHRSIFAMVGDMMIRLFDVQPKAKKTTELTGIVLIDELESHLHPKWQKEFPALLARLFPKVQFIVTTHSAICFLGMPKNSVFFHVQKNENGKIGIEKIDIDIENLLPNHILTSPIFGMENIRNVQNIDEQKVPTSELSYEEVKKRAETQAELKELAKKFVFPKNLQKK